MYHVYSDGDLTRSVAEGTFPGAAAFNAIDKIIPLSASVTFTAVTGIARLALERRRSPCYQRTGGLAAR